MEQFEEDDHAWRFEVRARDRDGQHYVVGWTDDPGGGSAAKLARRDPSICEITVVETAAFGAAVPVPEAPPCCG